MTRTMLNLDTKALREAAEELGTTTREATVNAALRAIAGRRIHLKYAELLMNMDPEEFEEHQRGGVGPWRIGGRRRT